MGRGQGQAVPSSGRWQQRSAATANTASLSWAEHPLADDQQLAAALASDFAQPATALRFRRRLILLNELQEAWQDPEDFLLNGDDDGYESALAFAEAYRRGEQLDPITVSRQPDQTGWIVADGWHRISGAYAAEHPALEALEAYDPSQPEAVTVTS